MRHSYRKINQKKHINKLNRQESEYKPSCIVRLLLNIVTIIMTIDFHCKEFNNVQQEKYDELLLDSIIKGGYNE